MSVTRPIDWISAILDECECEIFDVLLIEVRRGLVECQNAAVQAEHLCQGESDEETSEYLLAGGAPASHVQPGTVARLHHNDPIIVVSLLGAGAAFVLVTADLQIVDICRRPSMITQSRQEAQTFA